MLPDTFNLADYSTAELKHIYEYLKNAFEGQDINLERELIEHYRQCKDARDQAMTMLHSGENSSAAAKCDYFGLEGGLSTTDRVVRCRAGQVT